MSKSALASITAQYTDSENEDDHLDEEKSSDSQISLSSQVVQQPVANSTTSRKKKRSKVRRLVSYQDDNDNVVSESESSESDESEEEENNASSQDNTSSSNTAAAQKDSATAPSEEVINCDEAMEGKVETSKTDRSEKYAHYSFNLPQSPKAKVPPEFADKIRSLYEKMETNNMDMNRIIQERKEFRNPSIYEKLIQFCNINEFGTNYPPEIYDPLRWGPESYYEELAQVQNNEMQKRRKQRKEVDKIEQATALARKVEEEAKKRKSKWDQPAPKVVPQALTTTVTGTKGTVISAFGSLPKKPAV